jgi:maltooligosyltrehalose trehalohydrolase
VLRFFSEPGADRLLIVNLGRDLLLGPTPEPLLAPVDGHAWRLLWSSEAPRYGGAGVPVQDAEGDWLIPGQTATVLAPGPSAPVPKAKNVSDPREANG